MLVLGSILGVCVAFFLLEPAYYHLRSKRRRAGIYVWAAILATVGCLLVALVHADRLLVILALLSPVSVWILSRWLPDVPGAPGRDYLNVQAECPHCGEPVSFPRKEQGNAALCPACSEMMDVPHEEGEDRPRHKVSTRRTSKGAWITLFQNLNPSIVELQRMRLDAAGIPSFEADACTACADPVLAWAGGGVRLMVQEEDLAQAQALFLSDDDALELPDDFVSEPMDEVMPPGDGAGLFVLEALVLSLFLPILLAGIWKSLAPAWGLPDGVIEGDMASTHRYRIMFGFCLMIVLVRGAWVLRRGRQEVGSR